MWVSLVYTNEWKNANELDLVFPNGFCSAPINPNYRNCCQIHHKCCAVEDFVILLPVHCIYCLLIGTICTCLLQVLVFIIFFALSKKVFLRLCWNVCFKAFGAYVLVPCPVYSIWTVCGSKSPSIIIWHEFMDDVFKVIVCFKSKIKIFRLA